MNQISEVCVMDEGDLGFGVYYRTYFVSGDTTTIQLTWHMFDTGYDRGGAIIQADALLGRTYGVLADHPGEGIGCGNYFGAFNAPFVYRTSL